TPSSCRRHGQSSSPSTCLAAYSISSRSYQSGRLTERWLFSSFKRTATATLSQRWAKSPRWRTCTTWRTATTSVTRSPRRRAAAPGRSSPPKSSMKLTSLFDIGRRERQDEREELAGRLGERLQERVDALLHHPDLPLTHDPRRALRGEDAVLEGDR